MIPVSIELPSRVVATCLAPLTSTFDHRTGRVVVRAGLYLDEAAYQAGAQPVEPPQDLEFTAEQVANTLGGLSLELTEPAVGLLLSHARFAPPAPEPEQEQPGE